MGWGWRAGGRAMPLARVAGSGKAWRYGTRWGCGSGRSSAWRAWGWWRPAAGQALALEQAVAAALVEAAAAAPTALTAPVPATPGGDGGGPLTAREREI